MSSSIGHIVPYRQLMLRHYHGPAVGPELAVAARTFAHTYRFIPPRNAEERGYLRGRFSVHLDERRFADTVQELSTWSASRQDTAAIDRWIMIVSREEAIERVHDRFRKGVEDIIAHMQAVEADIIIPLRAAVRTLAEAEQGDGISQDDWETFRKTYAVRDFIEPFRVANRELISRFRYLQSLNDLFVTRPDISEDGPLFLELFEYLHNLGNKMQFVSRSSHLMRLLVSTPEQPTAGYVAKISNVIDGWYEKYGWSVLTCHRCLMLEGMERIERSFIAPLEKALEPIIVAAESGDEAEFAGAVSEIGDDMPDEAFVRSLAATRQKLLGDTLDHARWYADFFKRMAVPDREEGVSTQRHLSDNLFSSMIVTLNGIMDNLRKITQEGISMGITRKLSKQFTRWQRFRAMGIYFEGWDIIRDFPKLPVLEHLRDMPNVSVDVRADLPAGMNQEKLRTALLLLIDNAKRRKRREYGEGEEFHIPVTIHHDRIDVKDNGIGMSPERLAEVKKAIRTGQSVKSDGRGSTGRGLIDISKAIYPSTLEIQSTLGVGSTFTIGYHQ